MMNIYLLALNHADPRFNPKALHQYIQDAGFIDTWWHWLPSVYIFRSPLEQNDLTLRFRNVLPDGYQHVFLLLDRITATGWLPATAWDWLNKQGDVKYFDASNSRFLSFDPNARR
ncbi:hypothetical protein [Hypericibacter sp.]|uniref:hypothetical protein n=1 Tax=Hypericibacter sp. TaxID=2705401 RepID=UPI003D6C8505